MSIAEAYNILQQTKYNDMLNFSPAVRDTGRVYTRYISRLKKFSQYACILLYQERARTLVCAYKRENA